MSVIFDNREVKTLRQVWRDTIRINHKVVAIYQPKHDTWLAVCPFSEESHTAESSFEALEGLAKKRGWRLWNQLEGVEEGK